MTGFESVGQILSRTIKGRGTANELLALQIRNNFPECLTAVFGHKKLPKITAGKFSFGVLTVLVPDPVWSAALRQKEVEILRKLNATLSRKVVEKLRFRIVSRLE